MNELAKLDTNQNKQSNFPFTYFILLYEGKLNLHWTYMTVCYVCPTPLSFVNWSSTMASWLAAPKKKKVIWQITQNLSKYPVSWLSWYWEANSTFLLWGYGCNVFWGPVSLQVVSLTRYASLQILRKSNATTFCQIPQYEIYFYPATPKGWTSKMWMG